MEVIFVGAVGVSLVLKYINKTYLKFKFIEMSFSDKNMESDSCI